MLLFDGVFLMRPELAALWDLTLFVEISEATSLRRALQRDSAGLGGPAKTSGRYVRRYLPGQRLYLAECRLRQKADLVIVNDDPARPELVIQAGRPAAWAEAGHSRSALSCKGIIWSSKLSGV